AKGALTNLDPTARGLLERLASGVPRGTIESPPSSPRSAVGKAVAGLIAGKLLRRVDAETVELPREVGIAIRGGEPLGPILVQPPADAVRRPGTATVDGTGGGQALATVERLRRSLDNIGQNPPPALKSGGLGIRELRKLAKAMGSDEAITAMDVEVLAAAGLIAAADARGRMADSWTPTAEADDFLDGPDEVSWAHIAAIWLDLRRNPSRVGSRDASDKVQNTLSPELSWIRGPAERRFVLTALAELPAGSGLDIDALTALLAWRSPLRPAEQLAAVLRATIAEATVLGVVAFDSLTTAGRAVLAGSVGDAESALRAALPDPVDTLVVQADLTVLAPGRLIPRLAARIGQVADIESAGSATVYRVTPQSIRRALDAGVTAAELHELFTEHSMTGVPQALTYLIDDVSRRYGVLRLGKASTYLRSDDPALIDQAVAEASSLGINLRRLAPTVAISTVAMAELMTHLRTGGLVPAAEDASGAVVDLRPRPKRTKQPTPAYQHWREPPLPNDEQLDSLVTRMRSADRTGALYSSGDVLPASDTMALLREAVDQRRPLWVGYVDAEGGTSHRMIDPVAMSSGAVVAYDRLRGAVRTFVLHRITGVRPVADDELGSRPSV
ncbi:MAG: helicase C-terminal domain-containing protein, partial [Nakamurella sp.]